MFVVLWLLVVLISWGVVVVCWLLFVFVVCCLLPVVLARASIVVC